MDGFLAPVQDALQNFSNRQNQLTGIGMQEQGENQRLAATHWENQRTALAKSIQESSEMEPRGSALRHQYLDMWTRLLGEKPGAKLDNYHTEFSQLQNHARAADQEAQAVAQASQPRQGSPAPAAPGQTPGTPPIVIPPMPDVGYNVPSMPTAQSAGSAMPGTSPIQPSQQGGGSSPNTASTFRDTAVPPAAGPSSSTGTNAAGLGHPRNQGNTGTIPPIISEEEWNMPMTPDERKRLEPLYMAPKIIQAIRGVQGVGNYPFVGTEAELQALGLKPTPGLGTIFAQPQRETIDVSRLSPEDRKRFNIPEDAVGNYTALRDRFGNYVDAYPSRANMITVTGPDGRRYSVDQQSIPPGSIIQTNAGPAIDPAAWPTITQGVRTVQTADQYGNPVTELVPVTTSTRKALPGASQPAPAAGQPQPSPSGAGQPATSVPPVNQPKQPHPQDFIPPAQKPLTFPKALTPEQIITKQGQMKQYGYATERLEEAQKLIPELLANKGTIDRLIEQGKIQFEIDPETGWVNRTIKAAIPLTPQEEKLISTYLTLREDINLARGVMMATGFRGPEAFWALQSQRGELLQNMGVNRQVINNTLQSLRGQRDTIANYFNRFPGNKTNPTNPNATPAPQQPSTPAPAPALSKTAEDYLRRKGKIQ